jgi:thiol-disulfide isomerase/thioredoxin
MRFLPLFGLIILLWCHAPSAQAAKFLLNKDTATLPDVSFTDDTSSRHSLRDFRGHYVALMVWATWCPTCLSELSAWNDLHNDYRGKNLLVVPLASGDDSLTKIRTAYRTYDAPDLGVFMSTSSASNTTLGVRYFPTTIFIDPNGRELWRLEGVVDWSDSKTRVLFDHYLNQ